MVSLESRFNVSSFQDGRLPGSRNLPRCYANS